MAAAPRVAHKAPTPSSRDDRQAAKQARVKQADRTRPLRNQIKQIDDKLAALARERGEVEALLAKPGLDAQGFAEQGRRVTHLQADVVRLEAQWLELHEQLEAIELNS